LLAGIFPSVVIDAIAPVARGLTGARMPVQLSDAWMTITPMQAARSSYNGLLVFGFVTASILLAIGVVHRVSRGVRRGPAWDCGFPDPTTMSQYSASSFAQPFRRVFGTVVFQAKETVTMPPPGDNRAATIVRRLRDPLWDSIYVPLGQGVGWIADRANRLQFLTIRRYLGFVFAALVVLLMALTIWQ
jgi:hydrogenase-4 component B